MADLTVKVDVDDLINQIEALQWMQNHCRALPILIEYIKIYMPEPHKSECLAYWDKARVKESK